MEFVKSVSISLCLLTLFIDFIYECIHIVESKQMNKKETKTMVDSVFRCVLTLIFI